MSDLPGGPGSYALQLSCLEGNRLEIGRLGCFTFPPGLYIYCGSAQGKGGVRGRTKRYLRGTEKHHWHIDFLLPYASLEKVFYIHSTSPVECTWSQALASLPHTQLPARSFGASDCKSGCKSHLVLLPLHEYEHILQHLQQISGTERIRVWQAGNNRHLR